MLSNALNAQRMWLGFHLPDPKWLNMRANKIKSGITLHSEKHWFIIQPLIIGVTHKSAVVNSAIKYGSLFSKHYSLCTLQRVPVLFA